MNRERVIQALTGARRYLFKGLAIIFLSAAVSFVFSKDLLRLLIRSVDIKVYYLSFPEVFLTTVEIAIYGGVFFALPVLICLLWYEFRSSTGLTTVQGYLFIIFSILLFYAGSVFCYLVVLPSGITFLLGYGTGHIKAMISVQKFVGFCTVMIFAFGLTFEVPIVLLALSKAGMVKSRTLVKTRRYAILFITIGSALITPTPDVYNMMLLAVPAYVLFEAGIVLMKISERKRERLAGKEKSV